MMDADERAALIALGTPEHAVGPPFDLVERFRATVARAPGAIAVEAAGMADDRLSYGALDARSDGLAAVLQSEGAGPGQIVAIKLGRSPDYIVALIAVLKTGAAFLPVDPAYPEAVIAHMLGDSAARLIVTDDTAFAVPGSCTIRPDADPGDRTLSPLRRDPNGRAYVIYTSGSTGLPKGVVIPDRALAGHVDAVTRLYRLTPDDRVFQFLSLSFDFSLEEIIPTLLSGATLVLRSDAAADSARTFLEELANRRVTTVYLPTAFFHVLVDFMSSGGLRMPPGVRTMNIGGERVDPRSLREWLRIEPEIETLNGYGPTETTITCTVFLAGPDLPEGEIPIGSATDHTCLYVAAKDGSLAPRGAIGELWIGGVGVGDGYLGLPDRTALSFLPDHFRGKGRVYRSGDRASWRPDGDLNFLGRKDRQVKLRGVRIDLGQIERALERSRPDLQVLAAVRDPNTPKARLLAWAMAIDGAAPVDIEALSRAARSDLPAAMRPQIIAVSSFPRTARGKIDLAALPEPEHHPPRVEDDTPMSELETRIAALFTQTLGGTPIGAQDDFYELGGHSLMAASLVGRIETELGAKISVLELRRHPTPRGLAEVVRRGSSGPRNIFPIQPLGSRPPLFAVHILGGVDGDYYTGLAEQLGPDQPVLGLSIGVQARDKPTGIENTAERYLEEIQEFHPEGPINLAAVSLGAYFAWELARRLRAAGREVGLLVLFDAAGPGGRGNVSGLARVRANLRTIRHRGYGAIPAAIANRLEDLRFRRIASRRKHRASEGEHMELVTGVDFIVANQMAVDAYVPQPIDVPLTIFRSQENFFDSEACIRSGLGWQRVAQGGYEVIDVPGGHLTMLDPPHVAILAGHIARALSKGG